MKVESAIGARDPIDHGLKGVHFSGDLVMESLVTSMPELAAALSICRPVASGADEVLAVGVPYLKSPRPGERLAGGVRDVGRPGSATAAQ